MFQLLPDKRGVVASTGHACDGHQLQHRPKALRSLHAQQNTFSLSGLVDLITITGADHSPRPHQEPMGFSGTWPWRPPKQGNEDQFRADRWRGLWLNTSQWVNHIPRSGLCCPHSFAGFANFAASALPVLPMALHLVLQPTEPWLLVPLCAFSLVSLRGMCGHPPDWPTASQSANHILLP